MYTLELQFSSSRPVATDDRDDAINTLLNAYCRSGQVLTGSPLRSITKAGRYSVFVSTPERQSLSRTHASCWVVNARAALGELGISIKVIVHGRNPESFAICNCSKWSWLVLFTHFLSEESPLRCGTCFGTIPLYWTPKLRDDEYGDMVSWRGDYRRCDGLQMGCSTGERFGTSQLSDPDSSLSRRGRDICDTLTRTCKVPVFYYLYRGEGRTISAERKRRCPGCRAAWLVDPPLCDFFDQKCDRCRLVSNIAWNVRGE